MHRSLSDVERAVQPCGVAEGVSRCCGPGQRPGPASRPCGGSSMAPSTSLDPRELLRRDGQLDHGPTSTGIGGSVNLQSRRDEL